MTLVRRNGMTADEFLESYAQRSGVSVDALERWNREVRPCGPEYGCDYDECQGWQLAHVCDCGGCAECRERSA